MQKTPKVNLYPINGTHWEHFKTLPAAEDELPAPVPERRIVGLGAALGARRLARAARRRRREAGDLAPLLPASSPCSRETAQWTAGVGVEPDLRHHQQHLRGQLADLLDRAAGRAREDRGPAQDEPVGEPQHHRRDAGRGAERGRTGRQIRTDHGRLPAGEPAGDRPEPRDLRAEARHHPALAPVHERKPAGRHARPADRIRSRDLPDRRDRPGGRPAAPDDRHGQHVHRHADACRRSGRSSAERSLCSTAARTTPTCSCRSSPRRGTARGGGPAAPRRRPGVRLLVRAAR